MSTLYLFDIRFFLFEELPLTSISFRIDLLAMKFFNFCSSESFFYFSFSFEIYFFWHRMLDCQGFLCACLFVWFAGAGAALPFSSVQFSHSVVSDSLQPHESQHTRPPCPSPTPGVHSKSCPSSQWCHPAISYSVIPFSSCPQSLPASEFFPMSQLFSSSGPSIGVSALASFLPKNTQGWTPLGWTGWISLQSKGLSRVFSNTTVQNHQLFSAQLSSQSNSHIHTWPLEKP